MNGEYASLRVLRRAKKMARATSRLDLSDVVHLQSLEKRYSAPLSRVWVPAHIRLLNYLATLPHESEFILSSPKGGAYRKTSVTNIVCDITAELGFKGYSPHGLRHLAGAALAEAGCSVPQVMAILGHITEKQAIHYVKQANRVRLGEDAIAIWERADERQNVVALHIDAVSTSSEQSAAELEKRTGKTGAK